MVKQPTVSTAFCIGGIALQSSRTSQPGADLGDPLKQAVDNLDMESFVSRMHLGVLPLPPWSPLGYSLHSGNFLPF